jgi:hypothetical protein
VNTKTVIDPNKEFEDKIHDLIEFNKFIINLKFELEKDEHLLNVIENIEVVPFIKNLKELIKTPSTVSNIVYKCNSLKLKIKNSNDYITITYHYRTIAKSMYNRSRLLKTLCFNSFECCINDDYIFYYSNYNKKNNPDTLEMFNIVKFKQKLMETLNHAKPKK